MKLKTILLVPLLIVALAYVGAKGYIYYKTKDGLDKMIRMASPIVQIDYSDIGSELSGAILIDNVRITPTGTYDEITIQQLRLSGNGFNFLLDLARGFKSKEIPAQMTISFHKLQSPVSSSFISNLVSSFGKTSTKNKIKSCSIPGILNAVGLKELGVPAISINGSMGYMYDKEASQAEYNLRYDLLGVESSLFDLRMSQLSAQGMMGLGKLPIVDDIHIVRQFDQEYMKQIVNYCATEASLSSAAFIDDLFTQSDDYYLRTLGFIPGPGLSELFKQLISNAGTVEIRANPSSELSQALLKAYRPEDLIDLFGVTASYNGTPVTDLSFSMQSSMSQKQKSAERTARVEPPVQPASLDKPTKPKQIIRPKLRYLDTKISDLKEYINYKVRAYTLNNSIPKEGILVSISNNTINIEHLVFSGKMTSHLHIDRIEHIDVLRIETPEDK